MSLASRALGAHATQSKCIGTKHCSSKGDALGLGNNDLESHALGGAVEQAIRATIHPQKGAWACQCRNSCHQEGLGRLQGQEAKRSHIKEGGHW